MGLNVNVHCKQRRTTSGGGFSHTCFLASHAVRNVSLLAHAARQVVEDALPPGALPETIQLVAITCSGCSPPEGIPA